MQQLGKNAVGWVVGSDGERACLGSPPDPSPYTTAATATHQAASAHTRTRIRTSPWHTAVAAGECETRSEPPSPRDTLYTAGHLPELRPEVCVVHHGTGVRVGSCGGTAARSGAGRLCCCAGCWAEERHAAYREEVRAGGASCLAWLVPLGVLALEGLRRPVHVRVRLCAPLKAAWLVRNC